MVVRHNENYQETRVIQWLSGERAGKLLFPNENVVDEGINLVDVPLEFDIRKDSDKHRIVSTKQESIELLVSYAMPTMNILLY